jgi:hypothetical protein
VIYHFNLSLDTSSPLHFTGLQLDLHMIKWISFLALIRGQTFVGLRYPERTLHCALYLLIIKHKNLITPTFQIENLRLRLICPGFTVTNDSNGIQTWPVVFPTMPHVLTPCHMVLDSRTIKLYYDQHRVLWLFCSDWIHWLFESSQKHEEVFFQLTPKRLSNSSKITQQLKGRTQAF